MEVRTISNKLFGKHFGSSVFDLLKSDWQKYGFEVIKGDTLAQKLIVPLAGNYGNSKKRAGNYLGGFA